MKLEIVRYKHAEEITILFRCEHLEDKVSIKRVQESLLMFENALREQIAQEIEAGIKDAQIRKYQAGLGNFTSDGDVYWRDGMKEAGAIARGQK